MIQYSNALQMQYMAVILINEYYKTEISGGSAHSVLDDLNYDDDSIIECIRYAKNRGDFWAETILKLLMDMGYESRKEVLEHPDIILVSLNQT